MLFVGGFGFANLVMDGLTLFAFVVWFWLAISVFGDLCRRADISIWGKTLWAIGVILFPYLGVFAYVEKRTAGPPSKRDFRLRHHFRRGTPGQFRGLDDGRNWDRVYF